MIIKQFDGHVQIMVVVGLHSYNGLHAVGDHLRCGRWPGGAVLVDPAHGRDEATILDRDLGESPVHRAGGGLRAGPVRGVAVAPHGTGPVDGQSQIVPVQ